MGSGCAEGRKGTEHGKRGSKGGYRDSTVSVVFLEGICHFFHRGRPVSLGLSFWFSFKPSPTRVPTPTLQKQTCPSSQKESGASPSKEPAGCSAVLPGKVWEMNQTAIICQLKRLGCGTPRQPRPLGVERWKYITACS